MRHILILLKPLALLTLVSLSTLALAAEPAFKAVLNLDFINQPECEMRSLKNEKDVQKGRGNLAVDESTITWASTCIIKLPESVKYCALISQKVENPDAIVAWENESQTKVLRAKLISDADINPQYGSVKSTYICFE